MCQYQNEPHYNSNLYTELITFKVTKTNQYTEVQHTSCANKNK